MASQQIIKRRIKSVGNTKQITKAMQLVAASRLRKAQDEALGARGYMTAAREVLENLSTTPEAAASPMFQIRPVTNGILSIIIASDRGLAGAYNANIVRKYLHMVNETPDVRHSTICVGRYAADLVARIEEIDEIANYPNNDVDVNLAVAQPILREAAEIFVSGSVDEVRIVYTRFFSTVRQEVTIERLLPVEPPVTGAIPLPRVLEPSPDELIAYTVERLLEAQVLQAVLESQASEHASRMLAMKNATDNATELIEDLTLASNKARQANITQELAEISAGAEAMN